jgi:TonB family protein
MGQNRIYIIIIALLCWCTSFGQSTDPPKPRMTKSLMREFLNMHMCYPEKAYHADEKGTVKISFKADNEGRILERHVVQSASPAIDSSALKLFDLILWEPATYYGKPKAGTGEFKIKYSTSKYESLVKKRGYDKLPSPYNPVDPSGKVYSTKDLDDQPRPLLDSGYRSLPEFITASMVFPEAAAKLNIEGEVKLRFVIEASGLPSNVTVLQPVGGGCTEEAIRILNLIKWMPGIQEDMGVRTCFYLTIKFDAAGELKNKYIPNQSSSGI